MVGLVCFVYFEIVELYIYINVFVSIYIFSDDVSLNKRGRIRNYENKFEMINFSDVYVRILFIIIYI